MSDPRTGGPDATEAAVGGLDAGDPIAETQGSTKSSAPATGGKRAGAGGAANKAGAAGHAANKADAILDAAERLARTGGYNGFSFREVAAEVGIKSASVHYHFPTKADLCTAVARRYTERFIACLGDPTDASRAPADLLAAFIGVFRDGLVVERRMCLCGIFAAESASLPEPVATEARCFFEASLTWLTRVYARLPEIDGQAAARDRALGLVAALEGALLLARSLGDEAAFDRVAEMAAAIDAG